MARTKTKYKTPADAKLVSKNRKALFNYEVLERLEVGIVLTGTEAKSLRDGKLQLLDAYATVDRGEVFLHNAHISEYTNGTIFNHAPTRKRKLLAHRAEIDRLHAKVKERGFALIPLEVYFRNGYAKVSLGVCKGKASHDKRQTIRERDEQRARDLE